MICSRSATPEGYVRSMARRFGRVGWAVGRRGGAHTINGDLGLTLMGHGLVLGAIYVVAQVSEGEVEIVNVRETDPTLGPLVGTLVALGVATLVLTVVYWFVTLPARSKGEQQHG